MIVLVPRPSRYLQVLELLPLDEILLTESSNKSHNETKKSFQYNLQIWQEGVLFTCPRGGDVEVDSDVEVVSGK